MDEFLSSAKGLRPRHILRPPPKLTISEWADQFYYLSPESSAVPGRWTTLPYQREPLDAMGDPAVTHLSIMKSARVGYTRMLLAALGFYMHQDPAPCLVIQPTLDDARGFSKDDLQPMIRDCPVLNRVVHEEGNSDDAGNTMLQLRYPGGVVSLIGANSGTGLRRISRKNIAADEIDAYPVLIGEGDVIKLAQKRSEYYHDRRFWAGSTPLIAGMSRIEAMFEEGDARRYFCPCPQCGHMAPLVFSGDAGHAMTWPKGEPEKAYFVCQQNGCVIEEKDKRAMITAGEWRPTKEGLPGHRSYHMWSALSFSPGAAWGNIASEFLEAKASPERLRVFVNTTLGETWKERGEAPEWERLYQRREQYPAGSVPEAVRFLTAGVDVQKDRWVWEVVGWGDGKESWSIDSGVIPGDTSSEAEWLKLNELLDRTFGDADMTVRMLAVDSGYQTQMAYNWARTKVGRVIAVKGAVTARTLLGTPTPVDVTIGGKRIARGCKVWMVGTDIAKTELYGWLKLPAPVAGEPAPAGFCHFPEYPEAFFKELTAEQLVSVVTRTGFTKREWVKLPNRENHQLDARVYARVAAACVGLDRMKQKAAPAVAPPRPAKLELTAPSRPDSRFSGNRDKKNWLGSGSGWLKKKG